MSSNNQWVRHGECNHCGWCCTFTGKSIAKVENPDGLTDPLYLQARGFKVHFKEGIPISAETRIAHYLPCSVYLDIKEKPSCAIYDDRPQTCKDFPTSPDQIVGTPCSYYFESVEA